ncbi:MAG: hypothetical protein ABIN05_01505 [candidate division WOR-3 bacterium]
MIYALIPAKSESRRVKNKNFVRISGKTLFEITLDFAIDSEFFDKVIVSSDKNIDCPLHSKIIFDLRPKQLAKASTSMDRLILYVIKKFKMKNDDVIILLQPTSPLRSKNDLKKAMFMFFKRKKTVISVEKIKNKEHMFISTKDGLISLPYSEIYKQNGSFYIFNVKDFLKSKKIPVDFQPYLMERVNSIDIDEYLDYIISLILI